MKITLHYLPEFTLAGKLGQGKAEEGFRWIPPLWDSANADFAKIQTIVLKNENGAPKGMWGLMGNPALFLGRWDEQGLYLAGCEVEKDAEAPESWTKWTVPAQTYLAVECTQATYGEVFNEVISAYMPKHGLQMVGAAHENYPEPGNPEHVILYFPIADNFLYCQSCGMPMVEDKLLGTGKGGSNYDYCCYCYQNGAFTGSQTMEEMIELCLDYEKESGIYQNREQAKKSMLEWFPTLKRWKQTQ